jgi:hypothetical protein
VTGSHEAFGSSVTGTELWSITAARRSTQPQPHPSQPNRRHRINEIRARMPGKLGVGCYPGTNREGKVGRPDNAGDARGPQTKHSERPKNQIPMLSVPKPQKTSPKPLKPAHRSTTGRRRAKTERETANARQTNPMRGRGGGEGGGTRQADEAPQKYPAAETGPAITSLRSA